MAKTEPKPTELAKAPAYEYRPLMRVGGTADLQGLANVMKAKIAAVLPKHVTPERMLKALMVAASKTPKLLECTQESVVKSLMDASTLGLDCSGTLGSGYLIPFAKNTKDAKGEWTKRTECQFIPGFRGLIDLARRGGQIADIQAHMVYAQDEFNMEYGTEPKVHHIPYLGSDRREEYIGVYAVAFFKDGTKHPEFMTLADVDTIRNQAMAKNKQKEPSGPWKDHYVEMCKKTAIRRLCKTLPLSPELEAAFAMEDTAFEQMGHGPGNTITVDALDTKARTDALAQRLTAPARAEVIDNETGEITTPEDAPPNDDGDGSGEPSDAEKAAIRAKEAAEAQG